ncbi:TonB-dependent receptor [Methylobacillus gramineus]|uniref:TonB-dependent siderophore receptor n=1 Tax=Methylobacillus gramineus TaxID=755169 RepID=UPI001CFFEAA5|nr:TonB-dependent receptor [Methylobacillus gramineus]MCB5183913.1 TonB-dependent receptor [Methylobacillus gramineus]
MSSAPTLHTRRLRPAIQYALLSLGIATSILSTPVLAEVQAALSDKKPYELAAGPLGHILAEFAAITGTKLSFDATLLAGLKSPGLKGIYSIEEGFEQLLKGSAYSLENRGGGAYSLRKIKLLKESPDDNSATRLPEMSVHATKNTASEPVQGYLVKSSRTATKTDTALMEVPSSIQIVTRDVLDERQTIRLQQGLEMVSGIIPSYNGGNTIQQYYARGFLSSIVLRDGYRGRSLGSFLQGTAHIERIEVLKGPASVLYGRGEPGGIINQVSKQPLSTPYHAIKQQFGSNDLYRTTLDSTGPLNEDQSVLYRINAAYENSDSFRDFIDSEGSYFAPVLTWKISDSTHINFNLQYEKTKQELDRGVVAIGQRPASVPISTNLATPFAGQSNESTQAGITWSHDFTPGWTLRHQFVSEQTNRHAIQVNPSGTLNSDRRTMSRTYFEQKENFRANFNALELEGKFKTGSLAHKTLIGADYYSASNHAPFAFTAFPAVDVFNPSYNLAKPNAAFRHNSAKNDWHGIYIQDQIQLSSRVHVLFGGRYDQAKTVSESSTARTKTDDEGFSPRTGIVFALTPALSVYGSYTESFGAANSGTSFNSKAFKPETAQQYETGFKSELLDGRVAANLALYHLTKQNVLTADSINTGFNVQSGEARSRGVEIDITGHISPHLSLIANYAYTDATLTRDNNGNQGNQLSGTPKHAASLWGKYKLTGTLDGLSLGGGIVAQGQRQGDNANSFMLPGFMRTDLYLSYQWKTSQHRITTQLNTENLLDKEYFNASSTRGEIHPGYPRRIIGSIGIEF